MDTIAPTDNKTLRNFGLTSAVIVALLFGLALPWLRGHGWPLWPWYLSGAMLLTGLIAPGALRPVYRVWMKFGQFMGRVNSTIILTMVFFIIFTPVGIIMRAIRRDSLKRKLEKEHQSYRVQSEPSQRKKLERPF
jgi:integral membrane sensor domain MASE1